MPPSSSSRSSAAASFTSALAARGLDLVQGFDVERYNQLARSHPALHPVATFGRTHALAYAIGNTRALWATFTSSYQRRRELQDARDPLDTYVAEAIRECVPLLARECTIHLADEDGERLVSMVAVADASDLAPRGPAELAVHRIVGPWLGLRALVVVDAEPPPAQIATPGPCSGCPAPCVPALARALAETSEQARRTGDLETSWLSWVRVRDACPVGRQWRYGDAQLRYHYSKDRRALPTPARAPDEGHE